MSYAAIAEFPKCTAYNNADQVITGINSVSFNTHSYDTDNIHPLSSPSVFTCQTAGTYQICANIRVSANTTKYQVTIQVTQSGVTHMISEAESPASGGTADFVVTAQCQLAKNDTVYIQVDNLGTYTVIHQDVAQPSFSMTKLP